MDSRAPFTFWRMSEPRFTMETESIASMDDRFLFTAPRMQLEMVPTKTLKASKQGIRKRFNREEIRQLAQTMKTFGMLQPLEVNEDNEVVLGARRLEAAKLAFLEKVPVMRRASSVEQELEKQIVVDLHSKSLSLRERAFAFQRLMNIKKITKSRLATYLGLSKTLVCRTLAILHASEETQALLDKKEISERMVATVLYRLKDASKEQYVIKKIIDEKMSIVQAENLIAEVNNADVLVKHFERQVKSFETSLQKFREKSEACELALKEYPKLRKHFRTIVKALNAYDV